MVPNDPLPSRLRWSLLALVLFITVLVYWPGLYGGWLFDDYPNIVDNHSVQPSTASPASLIKAALSSPASDFKRPLASLSFAANYLATGLDPFWMKLTNLVFHLLNGVLVFLLSRQLLKISPDGRQGLFVDYGAALIAAGWLLLPINLTSVLYVVQRMESMANLFVLVGLIGYLHGRRNLLEGHARAKALALCAASLIFPVMLGALAKETAVMLPLYALTAEWILFDFRRSDGEADRQILSLFAVVLLIPLVVGLAWLLPSILQPRTWAARNATAWSISRASRG